jgi:hypothetical protein
LTCFWVNLRAGGKMPCAFHDQNPINQWGGLCMDFFEQVFHLWPDGGDGSTEIAIVVSLALALVFWWRARQHRGGIFTLNVQSAPESLPNSITDGEADAHNY